MVAGRRVVVDAGVPPGGVVAADAARAFDGALLVALGAVGEHEFVAAAVAIEAIEVGVIAFERDAGAAVVEAEVAPAFGVAREAGAGDGGGGIFVGLVAVVAGQGSVPGAEPPSGALGVVKGGAFAEIVAGDAAVLGVAVVAALLAVHEGSLGDAAVALAAGVPGVALDALDAEAFGVVLVVEGNGGDSLVGGGVDVGGVGLGAGLEVAAEAIGEGGIGAEGA